MSAEAQHALARSVIGFPPGGMPDVIGRRVSDGSQGPYAKAMILENKTGGGGQIAISETIRSPADGTTLLLSPGSMLTVYPHTCKRLSYNPLTDLMPVCLAGRLVIAIAVGPSVPASITSVPELLVWVKANSLQATYGSPGAGSPLNFVGELLSQAGGTQLQHVAYRGTQAALLDLIAGRLPIVISTQGEFLALWRAGSIRILGVCDNTRSTAMPNVPTLIEQGDKIDAADFVGFYLPRGATERVVQNAHAALERVLPIPPVVKAMDDMGVQPKFSTPAELGQFVKNEPSAVYLKDESTHPTGRLNTGWRTRCSCSASAMGVSTRSSPGWTNLGHSRTQHGYLKMVLLHNVSDVARAERDDIVSRMIPETCIENAGTTGCADVLSGMLGRVIAVTGIDIRVFRLLPTDVEIVA